MRRLILALGFVGLAAPAADAQFTYLRPNPFVYSQYSYRYQSNFWIGTPSTGYFTFRQQYQYNYAGNFVPYYFVPNLYNPGPGYGAYSYGSGSGLGGAAGGVADQQARALRQAQDAATRQLEARKQIFDQYAYEKGSKPGVPAPTPNLPAEMLEALNEQSEDAILSGAALNDLLKLALRQQARGAKVAAPFLPPDLLGKVVFAGGPTADALNLIRAGALAFPPMLMTADLEAARTAVEKEFAVVVSQANAGKKTIDPVVLDTLTNRVKRMKTAFAPSVLGGTGFDDSAAGLSYLNRLEAVAKTLKEPVGVGLFDPTWKTAGVGLAELTTHMGKHNLQFGRPAAGDESAYTDLHRGYAGYVSELAAAKK